MQSPQPCAGQLDSRGTALPKMNFKFHPLLSTVALLIASATASPATIIKGANGTEIDFVAIFDATPKGLMALTTPDATAMNIPWERIDLEHLKANQAVVFGAYQKAIATQKIQPIGLGLAESMISLSQLKDAMKQAVKDPYYWQYGYGYGYGYTYTTTTTGPDGQTSTRNYTTSTTVRYPNGYIPSNTPFLILKRLRDAKDDKEKREILQRLQSRGYGIEMMLEKMDSVLEKIPPEKMFKREAQDITLIKETERFKSKIRDLLEAQSVSADDQSFINGYLKLLGVN